MMLMMMMLLMLLMMLMTLMLMMLMMLMLLLMQMMLMTLLLLMMLMTGEGAQGGGTAQQEAAARGRGVSRKGQPRLGHEASREAPGVRAHGECVRRKHSRFFSLWYVN